MLPQCLGPGTFPGLTDGCCSDCLLQSPSYVRDTAFLPLCAPTSQQYPNDVCSSSAPSPPLGKPPIVGCICTSPCSTQRVGRARQPGHPHQTKKRVPWPAHSGQCEGLFVFYKTFRQQICVTHLLGAGHCASSRGQPGEQSTCGPCHPGVEGLAEDTQKLTVLNV